jgi:hypothetical protein
LFDGLTERFGAGRVVDAIKELPATLALTIRCSVPRGFGGGGTNFGLNTVRPWIDGVPRTPVNNVKQTVSAGDSAKVALALEPQPKR